MALVGNFSSGKSTLVNALLNERVLGMDRQAKTGVATYVRHRDSFARLRQKLGLDLDTRMPEGSFGVVRFRPPADVDGDPESLKADFATFLRSAPELTKGKLSSQHAQEMVDAVEEHDVAESAKLAAQLLTGKGPSAGIPMGGDLKGGLLKSAAETLCDVAEAKRLLQEISGRLSSFAEPPEGVEAGYKVVALNDLDRYVAKRPDDSEEASVPSDYVDRIDVFVESELLASGGVFVDLPGANNADERDEATTLRYLEDEEVDAVLLVVPFDASAGVDKTMKGVVTKIRERDASVKERLFLVVNKLDKDWDKPDAFEKFEATRREHYDFVKPERVFFASSILSLYLSEVDPVYGTAAPEPEAAGAAFQQVIKNVKGQSADWNDFLSAFASYVTLFSSQETESPGSITSEGSGGETVARRVSELYPRVITEASRLARLGDEIPHLAGQNVGIHTMYEQLRDYMMRTQYEHKVDALAKAANEAAAEVARVLGEEAAQQKHFPDSSAEYDREAENKLRDRFRKAEQDLEPYLRRAGLLAEERFESEGGLSTFDEGKLKIADTVRDVVENVNFKQLQRQLRERPPVLDEEIRLCEELGIDAKYLRRSKRGYFAEELLCQLVDMALRITAARLQKEIEVYITSKHDILAGVLEDEGVPFGSLIDKAPEWSGSLKTSLYHAGILNPGGYARHIQEGILPAIKKTEIIGSQRTVDSNYPDTPATWVSVYRREASEDTEPGGESDMLESSFRDLVTAGSFDESACRRTAELVLQGMVDQFMEEFHDRERLPFEQSITEDKEGTLKSELKALLTVDGPLYQECVAELRAEHEGTYEEERKGMAKRARDHSAVCGPATQAVRELERALEKAEHGISADLAPLLDTWREVELRYESDKQVAA